MKIIALADTHAVSLRQLPPALMEALPLADLIIHAGDFTHMDVLEGLRGMGEVIAVCGNNDFNQLRRSLRDTETFTINGKRIGLIHGWGQPWGMEDRIRRRFNEVDLIIYGHSHKAYNDTIGGVLFLNPGMASESYGILEIDADIRGRIINI